MRKIIFIARSVVSSCPTSNCQLSKQLTKYLVLYVTSMPYQRSKYDEIEHDYAMHNMTTVMQKAILDISTTCNLITLPIHIYEKITNCTMRAILGVVVVVVG